MEENRSCFHCKQFATCWVRVEIDDVLCRGPIRCINFDSDQAPGDYKNVFLALGNACLIFEGK